MKAISTFSVLSIQQFIHVDCGVADDSGLISLVT